MSCILYYSLDMHVCKIGEHGYKKLVSVFLYLSLQRKHNMKISPKLLVLR